MSACIDLSIVLNLITSTFYLFCGGVQCTLASCGLWPTSPTILLVGIIDIFQEGDLHLSPLLFFFFTCIGVSGGLSHWGSRSLTMTVTQPIWEEGMEKLEYGQCSTNSLLWKFF